MNRGNDVTKYQVIEVIAVTVSNKVAVVTRQQTYQRFADVTRSSLVKNGANNSTI